MSFAEEDKDIRTHALSWLRLDEAQPRDDIAAIFKTIVEGEGYIRNSQKVFAHEPERFLAYTQYGDVVMDPTHSVLEERDREIVALAVSAFNRCTVCIFSHAAELRRLTGDPIWVEKLALNPNHADLSARERALIGYALKLTEKPSDVVAADLDALRTVGLSEAAILELAHLTAYYNLSNRLMTGLGIRPTDEAYFAHRRKD